MGSQNWVPRSIASIRWHPKSSRIRILMHFDLANGQHPMVHWNDGVLTMLTIVPDGGSSWKPNVKQTDIAGQLSTRLHSTVLDFLGSSSSKVIFFLEMVSLHFLPTSRGWMGNDGNIYRSPTSKSIMEEYCLWIFAWTVWKKRLW